MATVFLVRHGLTAQTGRVLYGRTAGIDLDQRGAAQADELVERFEGVRLTAIYSSPLERCRQTVAPLASARRLRRPARRRLLEMDAGSWTGRTLRQVRRTKVWRTVQQTPSAFAFPRRRGVRRRPGARGRRDRADRAAPPPRRGRDRDARGHRADRARPLPATPLDEFQRIVIDTAAVSALLLGGRPPARPARERHGRARAVPSRAHRALGGATGAGRGKVRG